MEIKVTNKNISNLPSLLHTNIESVVLDLCLPFLYIIYVERLRSKVQPAGWFGLGIGNLYQ